MQLEPEEAQAINYLGEPGESVELPRLNATAHFIARRDDYDNSRWTQRDLVIFQVEYRDGSFSRPWGFLAESGRTEYQDADWPEHLAYVDSFPVAVVYVNEFDGWTAVVILDGSGVYDRLTKTLWEQGVEYVADGFLRSDDGRRPPCVTVLIKTDPDRALDAIEEVEV